MAAPANGRWSSRTVIAVVAVLATLLILAGVLFVLRKVKPDLAWPELPRIAAATPTAVAPTVKQDLLHWYFAEGRSDAPYQTSYAILNPGDEIATVTVSLRADSATQFEKRVRVAPGAQTTVSANSILTGTVFGTAITSTHDVYVERLMVGARDGTTCTGMQPALNWFFPEAQAGGDFDTQLVLFNPGDSVATVTVQPRPVHGQAASQIIDVAAGKRRAVPANTLLPSGAMALEVHSTTPIVAEHITQYDEEQAMYGGPGVPESSLSKTWYVTLANTETWYSARVAVFNPADRAVDVKVWAIEDRKRTEVKFDPVDARAKSDLNVNGVRNGTRVALLIECDVPIAVQLVGSYMSNRGDGAVAAFSALAAPVLAKVWYLPGAPGDDNYNSYLSLLNPLARSTDVKITYIIDESNAEEKKDSIGALQRKTMSVRGQVVPAGNRVVAVIVTSDRPIVVDRMTTFSRTVGATASGGIAGE